MKKIRNWTTIKIILLSCLAGLLLLTAVFGKYLAPYDPLEVNYALSLQPPSSTHWFGTDKLGRDILSRILCGAFSSFSLTFVMLVIIVLIGVTLGLIAGYKNGLIDHVFMRLADVLLAFPDTIFAIAVAGILGAGLFHTVFALALIWWTKYARLTRTLVSSLIHQDFIVAAKLSGAKPFKLIWAYLLPNVFPQILVHATLDIGSMMISLAGLSFLGLASQPPWPEWGYMLFESKQFMQTAPWMMVYPGLVILISVIIFNLLGDSLRDKLDPKQS